MDTCGDCDSDRHSGWDGRVKKVEAEKSASTFYFFISKPHPVRAADRKKKDEASQSIWKFPIGSSKKAG